ncbi:MAG: hypothetical protein ABI539_15785, partial [Acidobacteriota bacterium]
LLLNPIDWALIETWQERAVPLHVVIRAIESVFDARDKKPAARAIKGLMYCREEVEAQFAEWLESQAGKPDTLNNVTSDVETDVLKRHIGDAIKMLKANGNSRLEEAFDRAVSRLTEILTFSGDEIELIDRSLSDIEDFLEDSLLSLSDGAEIDGIKRQVAEQLSAYRKKMEPEAYEKTVRVMLLKALRDKENVPRLSLFYL